jgi:GNAT superfamily N-acetyltransferase
VTIGEGRPVHVVEIDPRHPQAFDAWFAVMHVTDQERWPDGPGWQYAERLAMALDEEGPEEQRCLSALAADGRVVGIADLTMYRRENRDVADLGVAVRPEARRHGVGRALVSEAERLARRAGRSELRGMDEVPTRPGYRDAGADFAKRLGFAPIQHMVRRALRVPLSEDRARELAADPRAHPSGYSLLTFPDRWPAAFIDDRCELGRRMSTDVPMGEQDREEEVWDEARVRQIEASFAAQNRAKVTTAARHDASGRLVAFTEIAVPLGAPESSWQHDTLVVREHRGRGLGFATKVANLAAVVEAHPAVRTINTWNAAENEHMIAVNEAMGFEIVAHSTAWLKKLAPG